MWLIACYTLSLANATKTPKPGYLPNTTPVWGKIKGFILPAWEIGRDFHFLVDISNDPAPVGPAWVS